jgi:hypothetical protein
MAVVTDNLLANLKKHFIAKFPGHGQVLDLTKIVSGVKILGFASEKVKMELKHILDKAVQWKMPETWEDID